MLRVGVVGAGYFARFHLEAWARMPRAALVAVADRDQTRAAEAASTFGAKGFDGLEALLERARPDILDLALPPAAQAKAIRCAVQSSELRAIICQKPFGADTAEAEALTTEAEAAGIPLIIHENFRFQPWYRAMRGAVEAGRLGRVQNMTFRLRTGDGQGPRAYLDRQPYFQEMDRFLVRETAVHWLDTFRYLAGAEPTHLYADLRRMNPVIAGEDAGHLILDFDDNLRALFDGNRLLDHAADNHRLTLGEALIEGEDGTLSLNGWGGVTLRGKGATEGDPLLGPQDWPGFAGDCVWALQAHVVAALFDGAPLENTARSYLPVRYMEEAAYRSAAEGRKIALGRKAVG